MKPQLKLDTHQKAVQINLDQRKYGTFAEIGAGQEVARWFFRVGGAAGTVAKTISAYDMVVSDAIYGQTKRYVSRGRLLAMLDHEYKLLLERLDARRGAKISFFVFANTVTARSFSRKDDGMGWMGVQFQREPRSEPSRIIIHVRLLDKENVQEQEALGIVGVNLIFGALFAADDPLALMSSLLDDLSRDRIEINMIKFEGPAFKDVDNRLMSLHSVHRGLTNAAMFTTEGEVVHVAEVLYQKPILIERGSFRPVTKVTADMIQCARTQMARQRGLKDDDLILLMEMTMHNLLSGDRIDAQDFLDRIDMIRSLGRNVLVSNFGKYYQLVEHLYHYHPRMIGIAMGAPTLMEVFDEKYYADLDGGLLESVGRLFKRDVKLFIYPLKRNKKIITAETLPVRPEDRSLYAHLLENGMIEGITGYDKECLHIFPPDVLAKIQSGDEAWQTMVPPQVAHLIKQQKLLGYGGKPRARRSLQRA